MPPSESSISSSDDIEIASSLESPLLVSWLELLMFLDMSTAVGVEVLMALKPVASLLLPMLEDDAISADWGLRGGAESEEEAVGIAVLVLIFEVEDCGVEELSFTSAARFLPRLRFLLDVLRGEELEECRLEAFEVEREMAVAVAVAPADDACLPTLAVRDSLSSGSTTTASGIFAGLRWQTQLQRVSSPAPYFNGKRSNWPCFPNHQNMKKSIIEIHTKPN